MDLEEPRKLASALAHWSDPRGRASCWLATLCEEVERLRGEVERWERAAKNWRTSHDQRRDNEDG